MIEGYDKMDKLMLISIMLVSTIIISLIIIKQYNRNKRLDSFCFFSLSYIIYFYIIPILVICFLADKVSSKDRFSFSIINAPIEEHVFAVFTSILGYILFYISYVFINKIKLKSITNKNKKCCYEIRYNLIKKIAWIIFIIGFSSEVYLIFKLGGIRSSLSMIELLRSGSIEKTRYVSSNMLFVFTIYTWIHAATFMYLAIYRIKRTRINFIMFIISMCGSIYALLLAGGRLQIILFITCFFYDYARKKFKHYLLAMIIISIGIIISLAGMDNLFYYLTYGYVPDWNTASISSILEEFAFPYANLVNVRMFNKIYGLRCGIDFIGWLTYLIPSKILSFLGVNRIEHGYILISEFYNGVNSNRGTVPTDCLTLGYRQFGIFGIYIIMIIYALMCIFIDKRVDKIDGKIFDFISIRILMLLFIIVPYADIENFVRGHFSTIILLIVVNIAFNKIDMRIKKHGDYYINSNIFSKGSYNEFLANSKL